MFKEDQLQNPADIEHPREESGSSTLGYEWVFRNLFPQSPYFITPESGRSISMNNLLDPSLSSELAESEGYSNSLQSAEEYSIVLSRLHELRMDTNEVADEDYGGAIKPTYYAFHYARSLIARTYALVGSAFTRAAVSVSFEGGIRIEWMRPDASVRAIVPAEEGGDGYIYFESRNEYYTVELSAKNLATYLLKIIA